MSALTDAMIDKEDNSEIETCILWVLDDAYDRRLFEDEIVNPRALEHAEAAAAELARLEHIEVVAESVNQWLKNNNLGGTGHQRELEAALRGDK